MSIKHYLENRKKKIDDLPSFLQKTSNLMQEGYMLAESLILLLPYYTKKASEWTNEIQNGLQNGLNAHEIFKKFQVDNEFLIAIYFAEKNGDLAKTLNKVSSQMLYKQETMKKFGKLLLYPFAMFSLLILFFLGFRTYFLPNISQMVQHDSKTDNPTIILSSYLLHMPDYFIGCAIFLITLSLIFLSFIRKLPPPQKLSIILKIPVVKKYYKLTMTRQFARHLGNLLQSGFSMQQALAELKTQQFKKDIQYVADEVSKQIVYGSKLSQVIKLSNYFYGKFELFVEHGEKNGLLGRELLLYCDILDEKLKNDIKVATLVIQPLFFVIIAICIVAAYLSILLPMYEMIEII